MKNKSTKESRNIFNIIGESINDSVRPVGKLMDNSDIEGINQLAMEQTKSGADYLDINVGTREPSFMSYIVKSVQDNVDIPLAIDSPDFEILMAGLKAYCPEKSGGRLPIVNSISELRLNIFELFQIQPFIPILMVSERIEKGRGRPNKRGIEIYETAKNLVEICRGKDINLKNDEIIIDPGLAPVGADYENHLKTTLDGMELIHEDPDLKGVHLSVGLSNFSVMLPPKTASGIPVRQSLENAFITLAYPMGLDFFIGNVRRNYKLLVDTDPALVALKEAIHAGGYESLERIQEFLNN